MSVATKKQAHNDVDLSDAYTPKEVARMLGVKTSTLATWRQNLVANKPPFVKLSRKVYLYPRAQYHAWANKQKLIDPDAI